MVFYFVCFEGLVGATPGKWLLGIRVVRLDRGKPGLAKSLGRNLLRLLGGLPALNIVGVVHILRSPEKARFGDRWAGTRVVHVGSVGAGTNKSAVSVIRRVRRQRSKPSVLDRPAGGEVV